MPFQFHITYIWTFDTKKQFKQLHWQTLNRMWKDMSNPHLGERRQRNHYSSTRNFMDKSLTETSEHHENNKLSSMVLQGLRSRGSHCIPELRRVTKCDTQAEHAGVLDVLFRWHKTWSIFPHDTTKLEILLYNTTWEIQQHKITKHNNYCNTIQYTAQQHNRHNTAQQVPLHNTNVKHERL